MGRKKAGIQRDLLAVEQGRVRVASCGRGLDRRQTHRCTPTGTESRHIRMEISVLGGSERLVV